jgi:BirA family biotin operon repressor/biotin-[acetyl-CoA-carboxylase] ligase
LGRHIEYFPFTDSTNDDIWELVGKNEAQNGSIILTDDQRKGRGRRNNKWVSSTGKNLTFSFLITPNIDIDKMGLLSLLVGVAICRGIKQISNIDSKLKWPNDILIQTKKVGGILIETKEINNKLCMCIGIGLNVNDELSLFPIKLQQSTTSLLLEKGYSFQREPLIATILNSIEDLYLNRIHQIHKIWETYCAHYHQMVTFNYGNQTITGKFIGINKNGYAQIEFNNEIHTYSGGELKL